MSSSPSSAGSSYAGSNGTTMNKSAAAPQGTVPSTSKQASSDLLGKPADAIANAAAGLLGKQIGAPSSNASSSGSTNAKNAGTTVGKPASNGSTVNNTTLTKPGTGGMVRFDSQGKPNIGGKAGSDPTKAASASPGTSTAPSSSTPGAGSTAPAAGAVPGVATGPAAGTNPSGNQVAGTTPATNTPESLLNKQGTKVGQLNCDVATGVGLIIGSTKRLDCSFTGPGRAPEHYTGHFDTLGLDVGVTGKSKMSWDVLAPEGDKLAPGSLAGTFSGASAQATAGVGVGGKTLFHGNRNGLRLAPSATGNKQTGLDVAGGVTAMTLNYAGK